MKTLSWNCKGCGNASTMRHLHDLISVNNPDIVFLSETKASITTINSLIHQFNYPYHFIIPPVHLAGGMCLLWKEGVDLRILDSTTNSITSELNRGTRHRWSAYFFYGSPYKHLRSQSWDPVRKLSNYNCPILVIGDLNVILSPAEVLGGKPYEYNDGEPVHDIINTQGFIDLGYKGYPYTWSNKRTAPDNIQKRLDRALVNSEWLLLFPEAVLSHKAAIGSDHCPSYSTLNLYHTHLLSLSSFNPCGSITKITNLW
ncbi:hypothetical protein IFM89_024750 [Coptis chinensis]|uniref:Endonuclease/exonuclease/phosphatase domain-containing protein n=1 Tax=Coptis chinensis TaxID=261450 RepID=A0A835LF20_9MAGN|nr:hypothetical protein IFM89_024750 [Coptis chinensis]